MNSLKELFTTPMHAHTFQSRFKIGGKITNETTTLTVLGVGCALDGTVYYKVDKLTGPCSELHLANCYLAPKYPIGSRVWIIGNNEIQEMIVTNKINNIYIFEGGNFSRLENQIFPTAEAARQSLKVIPLST